MRFSSLALLALAPALALASNVVDLTTDNFSEYVGQAKGALVEFYAPWCGHCKTLAPVYEQLADAFAGQNVVIAKTDADGVGKDLGKKFGVKGFPTLKYFPANSLDPIDYTSGRDLDSLAAFISTHTGLKSKIKPPPPSLATVLDIANHDSIALAEDKNVLVAYTAPWCGSAAYLKIYKTKHCKSLKPVFEKLAVDFANEVDVVVAQFDADDARNKPLAARYGVKSYPTIKFFPKGKKDISFEPLAYEGGRTEQAFLDFLNEQAGTSRKIGGGLSSIAGLIPSLDALTPDFVHAPAHAVADLVARLQSLIESVTGQAASTSTAYYLKVAQKIASKGSDARAWLVKEQARLAKLTKSPSLAPTKVDEMTIKANILGSFLRDKAADVQEGVEDVVEQAGEKVGEAWEGAKAKSEQVLQKVKEEL